MDGDRHESVTGPGVLLHWAEAPGSVGHGSEERFSEVRKLLEAHGWSLVRIRGSHHIFTKPDRTPINIPMHKNKVKPVYVAKVRKVIENDPPQESGA